MIKTESEEKLERIDVYNPYTRKAVTVNYHPNNENVSHHTHDFYEINYVLDGSITEIVSGHELPMSKGDAILMHPGVFHMIRDNKEATVLNILIRPQWFTTALSALEEGTLGKFVSTASSESYAEYLVFYGADSAEKHVCALIDEEQEGEAYSRLASEGHLLLLLAKLSRSAVRSELSSGQDSGYRRFAAILSYLYENSAALDASTLALRFGYSEAHLSRLFRKYTNRTPAEFLKSVRLRHVESLLLESDAPASHLASEAGFQCMPYFHRLFKSTYKMTPTEYRRAQKRK